MRHVAAVVYAGFSALLLGVPLLLGVRMVASALGFSAVVVKDDGKKDGD
jgi:hypothetical protein